jgi:thioredoxin reductase
MPPSDLLAVGRDEVEGYGGEITQGSVATVVGEQGAFTVALRDGRTVSARRLLVATGLRDELPNVAGLHDRWAKDVLHCRYCHGYEVRDKRLGVLGGSPEAVKYAQIVRQWSHDVVLFAGASTLTDAEREQLTARAVGIVEGQVESVVVEDDRLHGLALHDGQLVRRDVVFVPPRFVPNDQVLIDLGCDVSDAGWVVTDPGGLTTTAGVWAAGNVRNPRAQVITAAGEGSAAAIAINADLVEEDINHALRVHRG